MYCWRGSRSSAPWRSSYRQAVFTFLRFEKDRTTCEVNFLLSKGALIQFSFVRDQTNCGFMYFFLSNGIKSINHVHKMRAHVKVAKMTPLVSTEYVSNNMKKTEPFVIEKL